VDVETFSKIVTPIKALKDLDINTCRRLKGKLPDHLNFAALETLTVSRATSAEIIKQIQAKAPKQLNLVYGVEAPVYKASRTIKNFMSNEQ
jgi:hypothetical protein